MIAVDAMRKTAHCISEQPVHELCLDGFWMGRYEATQAQWKLALDDNPWRFQGPDNPVDSVTWHMAQELIKNFSALRTR